MAKKLSKPRGLILNEGRNEPPLSIRIIGGPPGPTSSEPGPTPKEKGGVETPLPSQSEKAEPEEAGKLGTGKKRKGYTAYHAIGVSLPRTL